MNIINMDGKLSGLDIDLSNEYSNLPKAKYVSNQNILNGIKHYTIKDTWNNIVCMGDCRAYREYDNNSYIWKNTIL